MYGLIHHCNHVALTTIGGVSHSSSLLLSGRFRLTYNVRNHNNSQLQASKLATEACVFVRPKTALSRSHAKAPMFTFVNAV